MGGKTIYKWKAFGEQHIFIPRSRGATSPAKAKSIARNQWKRKKFTPKRCRQFDWGLKGEKAYAPGYVLSGKLTEPKKKRKPRRDGSGLGRRANRGRSGCIKTRKTGLGRNRRR